MGGEKGLDVLWERGNISDVGWGSMGWRGV